MSSTLLIVNPHAGGGRAGRALEGLRLELETAVGPIDVQTTEAPGDGVRLARQACEQGRRLVIAGGGDGTVHEVVSGLVEARRARGLALEETPAVGIVGLGTGGDFTKTLGIPHAQAEYVRTIAAGHERAIDVGRLQYTDHEGAPRERMFTNILSMGVSGLADRNVAKASRAFGSRFAYLQSSIRAVLASRLGRIELRLTDESGAERREELDSRLLAICNGRFFGSGMEVAPMAKPDDGRFEVINVEGRSRMKLISGFGEIYKGTHIHRPDVSLFACSRIAVRLLNAEEAGAHYILDVDGEPLGRLPIEVELLRAAVRVRAPAA